jgi:endonuclease I
MKKQKGGLWNLGMAFCGAVLLFPWSVSGQTNPPAVDEKSTQLNVELGAKSSEFREILITVDEISALIPTRSGVVDKLRGQLHRRERQIQRLNDAMISEIRRSRSSSPSRSANAPNGVAPRVRRGGDWTREPDPGSNLYSSCQGLKDQALIAQLHEVSNYQAGLDYSSARRAMFTNLDNRGGEVTCVYTGRKGRYNNIPNDRDMNCEHTWPQSKGAVGIAKSDLHHLFPTDSKANSTRGSLPFGEVGHCEWEEGGSKCDGDVFEVRPEHRGNVARAKFYFAVRYGKKIERSEEEALRKWHQEDPVDAFEKTRNDKIENLQHNRNPFVDHPEFIDRISDF